MKTVTATNYRTGAVSTYILPTRKQINANYDYTKAEQWDPIERETVKGGLPLVWERVTP